MTDIILEHAVSHFLKTSEAEIARSKATAS